MVQTVVMAQAGHRLVQAESCLQDAFSTDVRPLILEWRTARGLPPDPLEALWQSGYVERVTAERAQRRSNRTAAASDAAGATAPLGASSYAPPRRS